MDLNLRNRRALITGSNTGIGRGIAEVLAAEGCSVVIHGRDAARAEKTAAAIVAAGGHATAAPADLTRAAEVAALVQQVQAGGRLDILVNNAGGATVMGGQWFETSEEAWAAVYERNVISAVRLIHAFVPGMVAAGWGRVINIGSAASTIPAIQSPDYQAAKAALLNLTVSLSKRLSGTGVTVNTVSPGPILTPGPRKWLQKVARERGYGEDYETPLADIAEERWELSVKRMGQPKEIAAMVALIASPLSDFTTGANMRVDGGQNRSIN
jgi:NAD(P)-dependent dehydrogenase (short-subunit alcohol dehydrogenase family)